MIALLYLSLAIVRLFVSHLPPAIRKQVFIYRLGICMFAMFLSPEAQMVAIAIGTNKLMGALVEVLLVIAVGEHLVYNDLEKRGALPPNAQRLPLGV